MNTEVTETITLAGGCFWCLEAVFERVDGVIDVESGYSNGSAGQPTYEQVCSGRTGHAEVVRVRFDPARISLHEVLAIFFTIHDPTQVNRQGNDIGTQYRSGIYFHTPGQEEIARETIAEAQKVHRARIATEVLRESNYSRAEEYHQRYFGRNPGAGYCSVVIAPKVEKFLKTFASRVRA